MNMSRIEKENAKYMIAVGADHATGAFLQVWHQPHDEQDGAFIRIDNNGVEIDEDFPLRLEDVLGESAWKFLMGIKERFAFARGNGIAKPYLDAGTATVLLVKLGFTGCRAEVHALLD